MEVKAKTRKSNDEEGHQRGAEEDEEAGSQLRRKRMKTLHFGALNLEAPGAPAPLWRPGAARSADVGGDQTGHHKDGRHLRSHS